MGTGGPRAVGHRTHQAQCHHLNRPTPPVRGQLLQAAAVSRCNSDPTCRKVPGEKSQGFPSGRSWWRGSQAWRGLDYIFVTPG